MRGDQWESQAKRMMGAKIISIECKGCQGTLEEIKHEGIVKKIERLPDAAFPKSSVIWVAYGNGANGNFKVVVARCFWSEENKRWEERI